MKSFFKKMFHWNPDRETLIALTAGLIIILLSLALGFAEKIPVLSIIIRDIGQIFIGILFPLLYIRRKKDDFGSFGFSLKKWYIFLPVNLVLGILLLVFFLSDVPPPENFCISIKTIWVSAFVMLAVIFEIVFFYGFIRTLLERAFGVIPGIILAAVIYSFHHAGFQPEFAKLFLVGLVFAVIYRIGNSFLLIFPFFAAVGALYDVLIQSDKVKPVLYPEIRTLYLLFLISGIFIWLLTEKRIKK